jgi:tetratricopeptide (TPR) repeat protein
VGRGAAAIALKSARRGRARRARTRAATARLPTQGPTLNARRRPPPAPLAAIALAALALLPAPRAAAATAEELADFDAKVEYAFFTEDARALAALVAADRPLATSAQALERYQYAHAEFRLLQVAYRGRRSKEVAAAADGCLDALDPLTEREPRDAEGLALAAACAGYLGAPGGLRGMGPQHKSEACIAQARELAPRNPRVLLVDGLTRWFRPGAGTADHAAARAAFEAAARAFETVTESAPGQPSWGEAEAWLFVGRALEEAGDPLGARNAYEKSLLIAPEFAAARRRVAALRAKH